MWYADWPELCDRWSSSDGWNDAKRFSQYCTWLLCTKSQWRYRSWFDSWLLFWRWTTACFCYYIGIVWFKQGIFRTWKNARRWSAPFCARSIVPWITPGNHLFRLFMEHCERPEKNGSCKIWPEKYCCQLQQHCFRWNQYSDWIWKNVKYSCVWQYGGTFMDGVPLWRYQPYQYDTL